MAKCWCYILIFTAIAGHILHRYVTIVARAAVTWDIVRWLTCDQRSLRIVFRRCAMQHVRQCLLPRLNRWLFGESNFGTTASGHAQVIVASVVTEVILLRLCTQTMFAKCLGMQVNTYLTLLLTNIIVSNK